jgi:hypothetical protein
VKRPEVGGVEPDWLRDQVEALIRDGDAGTVIPSGLSDDESFATQEANFLTTMRDVLPKTIERILDSLANVRAQRRSQGS